ncbi:MAG: efflux RND transporter periplasmic adaptor subunit [Dehalococcoidia bacterium]|nr:efflux RND transporter periplasmic adaptor subunit [Dehalococcoidia bacterium]
MIRNKLLIACLPFICLSLILPNAACQEGPLSSGTQNKGNASGISATGFIEAEQVSISSEVGGKILDITVGEGDWVQAGSKLASLDDNILGKQIHQAEMSLELAMANQSVVLAGPRQEEISQKAALLRQAEAVRDGAKTAWADARAVLNEPQELNARIVAAWGQVGVAQQNVEAAEKARENASLEYEASLKEAGAALEVAAHQVEQARVNLEQASRMRYALLPPVRTDAWLRPPYGVQNDLQYELNTFQEQIAREALDASLAAKEIAQSRVDRLLKAPTFIDAARGQYNIALASFEMAKAVLADLSATRNNPLALKSQANSAETRYWQAAAAVDAARASLDAAMEGATPEQRSVAQAQVRQSEAALQLLRAQREKMTITSPISGSVAELSARRGEVIQPGFAFIKIVDLQTVTLKVYIPEIRIGLLKYGSAASVSVDSYPGRTFTGRITFISPEAEFTPRNIQTKEERVKTVFAVKITIDNPDGVLKPGMPADALIEQ